MKPQPVFEFQFTPERKSRFDVAFPEYKIAIEQNGGTFRRGDGAHLGVDYIEDLFKMNLAVLKGWRVLQYTSQQMQQGVWMREVHLLNFAGER